MFVFEKVRSKRFPWAWSFLRGLQAPLLVIGTPLNCLVDWSLGPGSSLYLSLGLILSGSFIMFLIDVLKRRGHRRRRSRQQAAVRKLEASKSEGEEEAGARAEDDRDEARTLHILSWKLLLRQQLFVEKIFQGLCYPVNNRYMFSTYI